jgi:hypothetical protein
MQHFLCLSLLDDMDQRKADLLETQLLVEQLEQREQMLEAQNEMLQVQIIILNFPNIMSLLNPACFELPK